MKKVLIFTILGLLVAGSVFAADALYFKYYGARSRFTPVQINEERMSDAEASLAQGKRALTIYRAVLNCSDNKIIDRQKVDASAGFSNYTCGHRKNFMCYSAWRDYYFVEYCENTWYSQDPIYTVPSYTNYTPSYYYNPNNNNNNYYNNYNNYTNWQNAGNYSFGSCVATGNYSETTTCSNYCANQNKTCLNYGCVHPNEPNSRFGAIFYSNNWCGYSPVKNFQCWDRFAPSTGAGVKCCCT